MKIDFNKIIENRKKTLNERIVLLDKAKKKN